MNYELRGQHNLETTHAPTYKVKIFIQFGVKVLYSVCVCNLAFPNSKTQNGSDLPPKSAAAKPLAP